MLMCFVMRWKSPALSSKQMGSLPQDQIKDVQLRLCRAWQIQQRLPLKGAPSTAARTEVIRVKLMWHSTRRHDEVKLRHIILNEGRNQIKTITGS